MAPLHPDHWILLILIFLLGLLIGMFVTAGRKWKRLYREEAERREKLEAENEKLRADAREMDNLRRAAAREPGDRDRFTRPV